MPNRDDVQVCEPMAVADRIDSWKDSVSVEELAAMCASLCGD